MTTESTYLDEVPRRLHGMSSEHRMSVLADLRAHFAEAAELGREPEQTVSALGSPEEVAARAREEFDSDERVPERAWQVLQATALAVAIAIGVVVAFLLPSFSTGEGIETLLESHGLGIALVALAPAVVAAIPLACPPHVRNMATALCAALIAAMVFIGAFSLGSFFLPVLLLSGAALLVRVRLRGPGFGRTWRVVGAVLAVLPVCALALQPLFGPFGLSAWAWPVFAAVIVLAILVGRGHRAASITLAAGGLFLLLLGLVGGGMIAVLVIALGGWWLTIGLAQAVTAPSRR